MGNLLGKIVKNEDKNIEQTNSVFNLKKSGNETKNDVVETVLTIKDKTKENNSIFDKSLLSKITKIGPSTTFNEEKWIILGKIAILLVIFISFVVHLFFYTQLSPKFTLLGDNLYQKWEKSLNSLKIQHNDLLKKQLIIAKINLDELSNDILAYASISEVKGKNDLKKKIIDKFNVTKKYLNFEAIPKIDSKIAIDEELLRQEMEKLFVESIDKDIAEIRKVSGEEKNKTEQINSNKLDLELLEIVKKIYRQKTLRQNFLSINLAAENFEENLAKLADNINGLNQNYESLIKKIQGEKMDIKGILQEIRTQTQKIDPNHDHEKWGDLSSIKYDSFSFGQDKITISGKVVTKDDRNYTIIADLIDTLEKSPMFKNVSKRSLAKNYEASAKEYSSTLQITLDLEQK